MKHLRLVLLAGQSNMSGRDVATPDDLTVIPGLYAFGKDNKIHPAVEPITRDRHMVGTFNADGERMTSPDPWDNIAPAPGGQVRGVGPGRTFGRLLLESSPDEDVALIPTSVGGTPISAWLPGGIDPHTRTVRPYDESIALAREAQKYGTIVAVLWHQGESDASGNNTNYTAEFFTVIRNFRRDLGLGDDVPFIIGELGDFYKTEIQKNVPMIHAAFYQAAEELPNVAVVSSRGLTHRGDNLHFDTASAHELGRRFFAKFQEMSDGKKN